MIFKDFVICHKDDYLLGGMPCCLPCCCCCCCHDAAITKFFKVTAAVPYDAMKAMACCHYY